MVSTTPNLRPYPLFLMLGSGVSEIALRWVIDIEQIAEAKSNRFEREVESGKEQLSKPSNPLTVSGVPEPEEWMLMGISAIALILISRHQRRAAS